jgi:hypothetical protein
VRAAEQRARELLEAAERALPPPIVATAPTAAAAAGASSDAAEGDLAPLPANVIDLRDRFGSRGAAAPVISEGHPSAGDPLDRMVGEAVHNAVRLTFRKPKVRAGRYR